MIKRKVFCEECRNDRTFTVTAKQTEGTIKVHCCSVQISTYLSAGKLKYNKDKTK